MGFIPTGSTYSTVAYLTQKGREYLITGDEADNKITFFAFGDSDTNYKILNKLEEGSVPDITGNNATCLKTIAQNIDIKNKISL